MHVINEYVEGNRTKFVVNALVGMSMSIAVKCYLFSSIALYMRVWVGGGSGIHYSLKI